MAAPSIAVYSGSFNPLHKGHMCVIRYLLESGGFDKVYLVVSPRNPFKDKSLGDSAQKRLEAVREAVIRNNLQDRVLVDDIEFGMPQPSYTVNTLDALKRREPASKFTLVIGGDNLHEMLLWREGARIMEDYGIVVYPREGYNMVHDCKVLREKHRNGCRLFDGGRFRPLHIKLLKDAPLVNLSSTQIREMTERGEDASTLLA